MSDKDAAVAAAFQFADLKIDLGQRRVWRGRTEIDLPRLSFDLLAALVKAAPNSLSTDDLMDRVWNGTVVSPATVAKRVELVREALGDDSDQPRYIALVRGHGYRLVPKVRNADTADDRKRVPLSLALLAVATVIVGAAVYFSHEATPPPEKSIAVLPFTSMSSDPEGEIFADGLTEELSHVLASLGDLKVAGRTSSFYFKGRNEDLREIGEMLGVAHVLEGSVRQSGDELRITAQLISTADGFHLWSESYDREMNDVIDIQKDIAQAVALKLQSSTIDGGELSDLSNAAISPDAYALYLKAVSLSPYGKTRDLAEAQALTERVTEMAPDFAPSWNRLAAIHGRRLIYGDPDYGVSPQESLAIAGDAVSKALLLDPTSGEAYANLGGAAWVFERDIGKAAPLIEKALQLDPWNLDIVSFAADFAKYIGRQDEALELEEILVSRDPICDTCRANLARSYLYARRFDDAEVQFQTLRSIGGGYGWTLGTIFLLKQQPERAREYFQQLEGLEQRRQIGEALALHDLGQTDESGKLLDQVAVRSSDNDPLVIAQAFAYVGDADKAFEWLEQALPAATLHLQTSFPHPLYDRLRDDPRWHAIMERIQRAPEQLDKIPFSLDRTRERLRAQGTTEKNWWETGESNPEPAD